MIRFDLHNAQLDIHDSEARFKVVAAGRRFGKSHLAAVELITHALLEKNPAGYDVWDKEVYYIAPTFEQAKKIMWPKLKALAKPKAMGGVIESTVENTAVMTLINGRRISIKGADNPDSLRGIGLSYVVLDEYAFMKPDVWGLIIRPALADVEGGALFIGTPDGKNHFYDQHAYAKSHGPSWQAWQFDSLSNPFLNKAEIEQAITSSNMTVAMARQEFAASFASGGGEFLKEEYWQYGDEPKEGAYYMAVDLAGFTSEGSIRKGELKVTDDHAIAVVKVNEEGWFVKEIISGKWDVRETAVRIIKAYAKYKPLKLGIEKGALLNALRPYLEEEMRRYNRYALVYELDHGGRAVGGKENRIRYALEGRLEKGRITLEEEESVYSLWQRKLVEQASDFPSPLSHDDLIDALAYIDQLADVSFFPFSEIDEWQPISVHAGI